MIDRMCQVKKKKETETETEKGFNSITVKKKGGGGKVRQGNESSDL